MSAGRAPDSLRTNIKQVELFKLVGARFVLAVVWSFGVQSVSEGFPTYSFNWWLSYAPYGIWLFTWLSLVMSFFFLFCAVLFPNDMSWMRSGT